MHGPSRRQWPALQQLPCFLAVRADPGEPDDGHERPCRGCGQYCRMGPRPSRLPRLDPQRCTDVARTAEPVRLPQLCRGEVAPVSCRGAERDGSVRPVAHGARFRPPVRLSWRGGRPLPPGAVPQPQCSLSRQEALRSAACTVVRSPSIRLWSGSRSSWRSNGSARTCPSPPLLSRIDRVAIARVPPRVEGARLRCH